MKILLASNNDKKRREMRRIVAPHCAAEIVVPRDLGLDLDPVEDGATFAENARKKGLAFSRETDLFVIADDSGLCVDALDGAPGIYSARFAGADATDADNRALLLKRLRDDTMSTRAARFVCAVVVAQDGNVLFEASGACAGLILDEERGTGGFGYDPLFWHEASGKTFADLEDDVKDQVSHRGDALAKIIPFLKQLGA